MIVSFLIYFNSSLRFGKTNNRIWQARNARDMLSSSKAKQSRVSRTLVEECKKRPEIFASYAYLEFRHRLRDTRFSTTQCPWHPQANSMSNYLYIIHILLPGPPPCDLWASTAGCSINKCALSRSIPNRAEQTVVLSTIILFAGCSAF